MKRILILGGNKIVNKALITQLEIAGFEVISFMPIHVPSLRMETNTSIEEKQEYLRKELNEKKVKVIKIK